MLFLSLASMRYLPLSINEISKIAIVCAKVQESKKCFCNWFCMNRATSSRWSHFKSQVIHVSWHGSCMGGLDEHVFGADQLVQTLLTAWKIFTSLRCHGTNLNLTKTWWGVWIFFWMEMLSNLSLRIDLVGGNFRMQYGAVSLIETNTI